MASINRFRGTPRATRGSEIQWVLSTSNVNPDPDTDVGPTATITAPAGLNVGDLVVVLCYYRGATQNWSVSTTGGQSWVPCATHRSTAQMVQAFYCRFNGTWSGNPVFTVGSGTETAIAVLHAFRSDAGAASRWALDQSPLLGSGAGSAFTITGATPQSARTLAMAVVASLDDNEYTLTTPGRWSLLGNKQYRSTGGTDASVAFARLAQDQATPTGNLTFTQATLGADAGITMVLVFREGADLGLGRAQVSRAPNRSPSRRMFQSRPGAYTEDTGPSVPTYAVVAYIGEAPTGAATRLLTALHGGAIGEAPLAVATRSVLLTRAGRSDEAPRGSATRSIAVNRAARGGSQEHGAATRRLTALRGGVIAEAPAGVSSRLLALARAAVIADAAHLAADWDFNVPGTPTYSRGGAIYSSESVAALRTLVPQRVARIAAAEAAAADRLLRPQRQARADAPPHAGAARTLRPVRAALAEAAPTAAATRRLQALRAALVAEAARGSALRSVGVTRGSSSHNPPTAYASRLVRAIRSGIVAMAVEAVAERALRAVRAALVSTDPVVRALAYVITAEILVGEGTFLPRRHALAPRPVTTLRARLSHSLRSRSIPMMRARPYPRLVDYA